MKFTQTDYNNTETILKFANAPMVGKAVMVESDGIDANSDGKKIVPAGTIVGGATQPVLENPDEPVAEKNEQGVDADAAEGVLLSDVDVTHGDAQGTMIIMGFIDKNKLPAAPAEDAVTALNMVKFIV